MTELEAMRAAVAAERQRADAAEADAAALPAMDAECARLRAQVDADRQTIVRLTDELADAQDERDALRAEVERLRPLASAEMQRRAIAEMMNGGET